METSWAIESGAMLAEDREAGAGDLRGRPRRHPRVPAGNQPSADRHQDLLLATFGLGRLHDVLSPHAYLWLLTAWVVMCAALATRTRGRADPEALARYLGERRVRT